MGEMADYYRQQEDLQELEMWLDGRGIDQDFIEECYQSNIWLTKDQVEIPLGKMTDSHLINAIAYIERGGEVYGYAKLWLPKLKLEKIGRGIL